MFENKVAYETDSIEKKLLKKSVNNNPQRIRPIIAVSYFARKIQEEEGPFLKKLL